MGIIKYKPTSPGRRHGSVLDFTEITARKPEKSLLRPLKKTGGRNNNGRVTARHRGGGHKRRYRLVDFKRRRDEIPANNSNGLGQSDHDWLADEALELRSEGFDSVKIRLGRADPAADLRAVRAVRGARRAADGRLQPGALGRGGDRAGPRARRRGARLDRGTGRP